MCKTLSEGGQRCAAHTRPAYTNAPFGTPQWDEAAFEHASTPTGASEMRQDLGKAHGARDLERVAALTAALRRGASRRDAAIEAAALALPSTPAPDRLLTTEELKASPNGNVTIRTTGELVGQVTSFVDEAGKKRWNAHLNSALLTYPGGDQPRHYASRGHAVQALTHHHNRGSDPQRWANAPAVDWTQQTYSYWNRRFNVADTLGDNTLLHGSPYRLNEGDLLLPDVAPVNFKQSDPFAVSLTTELRAATQWAHDASPTGEFYVYEVQPLTDVAFWQVDMEGWAFDPQRGMQPSQTARLKLNEGRVGAARIVSRADYTWPARKQRSR